METTIIRANLQHIHLIHVLATKVFPQTYRHLISKEQSDYMMEWMYSPQNLRKQMAEENHTYYIMYVDNTPAGYVSIQPEGENLYHLQKIYVLPEYQGYGLGKLLYKKAIEHVKEVHPTSCTLRLNVNKGNKAIEFYERMGMKIASAGRFDIGNGYIMDDYLMEIEVS